MGMFKIFVQSQPYSLVAEGSKPNQQPADTTTIGSIMAIWQNIGSYFWGSPSQQPASSATGQPLCLTITAYRKEGLTEEEYRSYLTTKHAPLVRPLMEQYGLLKYTIVRFLLLEISTKTQKC